MKSIDIISIPVTNQEAAKNFYINQLGFKIVFEADSQHGKWIQLSLPNDNTSITLVAGPMHAAAGSVKGTVILTDDIEKDVEVLRGKGVRLPDIQSFFYGKITTFSDPDGNQWVLKQAPQY